MAKKTPWKYFKRALVHAKIQEEGRKFVIHSLRHNYDTAMREAISAAWNPSRIMTPSVIQNDPPSVNESDPPVRH
jgi:hypothetical protein